MVEYQARLSGPLIDRIEIQLDVPAVTAADLALPAPSEGTAEAASRIARARGLQAERAKCEGIPDLLNSKADGNLLERIAMPDAAGAELLAKAAERMALSARAYHRTLRVARTIADLDGVQSARRIHIAEALSLRRVWAGSQGTLTTSVPVL